MWAYDVEYKILEQVIIENFYFVTEKLKIIADNMKSYQLSIVEFIKMNEGINSRYVSDPLIEIASASRYVIRK